MLVFSIYLILLFNFMGYGNNSKLCSDIKYDGNSQASTLEEAMKMFNDLSVDESPSPYNPYEDQNCTSDHCKQCQGFLTERLVNIGLLSPCTKFVQYKKGEHQCDRYNLAKNHSAYYYRKKNNATRWNNTNCAETVTNSAENYYEGNDLLLAVTDSSDYKYDELLVIKPATSEPSYNLNVRNGTNNDDNQWGIVIYEKFTYNAYPNSHHDYGHRNYDPHYSDHRSYDPRNYNHRGYGHNRQKRQSNDSSILGTRHYISCTKKGTPTDETNVSTICNKCWVWRELPDGYYPRYINELVCDDEEPTGIYEEGTCETSHRVIYVQENSTGITNVHSVQVGAYCEYRIMNSISNENSDTGNGSQRRTIAPQVPQQSNHSLIISSVTTLPAHSVISSSSTSTTRQNNTTDDLAVANTQKPGEPTTRVDDATNSTEMIGPWQSQSHSTTASRGKPGTNGSLTTPTTEKSNVTGTIQTNYVVTGNVSILSTPTEWGAIVLISTTAPNQENLINTTGNTATISQNATGTSNASPAIINNITGTTTTNTVIGLGNTSLATITIIQKNVSAAVTPQRIPDVNLTNPVTISTTPVTINIPENQQNSSSATTIGQNDTPVLLSTQTPFKGVNNSTENNNTFATPHYPEIFNASSTVKNQNATAQNAPLNEKPSNATPTNTSTTLATINAESQELLNNTMSQIEVGTTNSSIIQPVGNLSTSVTSGSPIVSGGNQETNYTNDNITVATETLPLNSTTTSAVVQNVTTKEENNGTQPTTGMSPNAITEITSSGLKNLTTHNTSTTPKTINSEDKEILNATVSPTGANTTNSTTVGFAGISSTDVTESSQIVTPPVGNNSSQVTSNNITVPNGYVALSSTTGVTTAANVRNNTQTTVSTLQNMTTSVSVAEIGNLTSQNASTTPITINSGSGAILNTTISQIGEGTTNSSTPTPAENSTNVVTIGSQIGLPTIGNDENQVENHTTQNTTDAIGIFIFSSTARVSTAQNETSNEKRKNTQPILYTVSTSQNMLTEVASIIIRNTTAETKNSGDEAILNTTMTQVKAEITNSSTLMPPINLTTAVTTDSQVAANKTAENQVANSTVSSIAVVNVTSTRQIDAFANFTNTTPWYQNHSIENQTSIELGTTNLSTTATNVTESIGTAVSLSTLSVTLPIKNTTLEDATESGTNATRESSTSFSVETNSITPTIIHLSGNASEPLITTVSLNTTNSAMNYTPPVMTTQVANLSNLTKHSTPATSFSSIVGFGSTTVAITLSNATSVSIANATNEPVATASGVRNATEISVGGLNVTTPSANHSTSVESAQSTTSETSEELANVSNTRATSTILPPNSGNDVTINLTANATDDETTTSTTRSWNTRDEGTPETMAEIGMTASSSSTTAILNASEISNTTVILNAPTMPSLNNNTTLTENTGVSETNATTPTHLVENLSTTSTTTKSSNDSALDQVIVNSTTIVVNFTGSGNESKIEIDSTPNFNKSKSITTESVANELSLSTSQPPLRNLNTTIESGKIDEKEQGSSTTPLRFDGNEQDNFTIPTIGTTNLTIGSSSNVEDVDLTSTTRSATSETNQTNEHETESTKKLELATKTLSIENTTPSSTTLSRITKNENEKSTERIQVSVNETSSEHNSRENESNEHKNSEEQESNEYKSDERENNGHENSEEQESSEHKSAEHQSEDDEKNDDRHENKSEEKNQNADAEEHNDSKEGSVENEDIVSESGDSNIDDEESAEKNDEESSENDGKKNSDADEGSEAESGEAEEEESRAEHEENKAEEESDQDLEEFNEKSSEYPTESSEGEYSDEIEMEVNPTSEENEQSSKGEPENSSKEPEKSIEDVSFGKEESADDRNQTSGKREGNETRITMPTWVMKTESTSNAMTQKSAFDPLPTESITSERTTQQGRRNNSYAIGRDTDSSESSFSSTANAANHQMTSTAPRKVQNNIATTEKIPEQVGNINLTRTTQLEDDKMGNTSSTPELQSTTKNVFELNVTDVFLGSSTITSVNTVLNVTSPTSNAPFLAPNATLQPQPLASTEQSNDHPSTTTVFSGSNSSTIGHSATTPVWIQQTTNTTTVVNNTTKGISSAFNQSEASTLLTPPSNTSVIGSSQSYHDGNLTQFTSATQVTKNDKHDLLQSTTTTVSSSLPTSAGELITVLSTPVSKNNNEPSVVVVNTTTRSTVITPAPVVPRSTITVVADAILTLSYHPTVFAISNYTDQKNISSLSSTTKTSTVTTVTENLSNVTSLPKGDSNDGQSRTTLPRSNNTVNIASTPATMSGVSPPAATSLVTPTQVVNLKTSTSGASDQKNDKPGKVKDDYLDYGYESGIASGKEKDPYLDIGNVNTFGEENNVDDDDFFWY